MTDTKHSIATILELLDHAELEDRLVDVERERDTYRSLAATALEVIVQLTKRNKQLAGHRQPFCKRQGTATADPRPSAAPGRSRTEGGVTWERENSGDVDTLDAEDDPSVLRAEAAADVINAPAPIEIVESTAWSGCVTLFPAESGAGKTFVAGDIAACMDARRDWHGRQTLQGSIAYCSFEADAWSRRLRALATPAVRRLPAPPCAIR